MQQYNVTGMSCAACSARVEKAVSKVEGVTSVSVSLLTNSMGVEGSASSNAVIKAVEQAGYKAAIKSHGTSVTPSSANHADSLKDTETPKLRRRFIASLFFLIILMYISMGHKMWGWPLPESFANNHIALALSEMLLTIMVMVINQRFFVSGFTGLIHRSPNMDTLVAIGSAAGFVYSTYVLFAMTFAQVFGDTHGVHEYMHDLYFESSAMILTLITFGKMLEAYSKGKTKDALKSLMELSPRQATVIRDGKETTVPIEEVQKGDIFVVRPGENIPVDGIIIEGSSSINEAALTGESIPVDKTQGDHVSAATINQEGFITCEAQRVGEDTTLAQIIQLVSDAAATKAPIAKVADRVSGVFVPVVIAIAIIATTGWLLAGQSVGFALARGISVLVISCPCALGLATPVAIMVGNGKGARNGILFKTASSLEQTGKAQIVVLDKTGTITMGNPMVTDVIPGEGISKEKLVQTAASLENKSEHPLAKAILSYAKELGITPLPIENFKAVPGNGLTATMDRNEIVLAGGKYDFVAENVKNKKESLQSFREYARELSENGKTPLYFLENGEFIGCIAVADIIKPESPQAIQELKNMGIHVVMLTGDNEQTARAIAGQAGVDEVIANVLPSDKESEVRHLQESGKVIMVGDGINDAPALTRADIGMAIGAGTDVAIEAADVVLMKSSLNDISAAIRLSRAVLKNIHQNLFWAFFYNTIGIPLAAGVWIPVLGWQLNPMFGAAAMGLSSFCVVSNALRLNLVDLRSVKKDKKIKHSIRPGITVQATDSNAQKGNDIRKNNIIQEKENEIMTKTMKIEGMMCGHCEARVKKVLEAVDGVEHVVASHQEGTAVVTLSADVADDVLKATVEDQDYQVLEIQ